MAKEKYAPLIKLNDHMASNWKYTANPVAVLNQKTTLHERIAYCWGLAENLSAIAQLGIGSDDGDVSAFASLVSSSLAPLLVVLGNIGDESFESEKKGVL